MIPTAAGNAANPNWDTASTAAITGGDSHKPPLGSASSGLKTWSEHLEQLQPSQNLQNPQHLQHSKKEEGLSKALLQKWEEETGGYSGEMLTNPKSKDLSM